MDSNLSRVPPVCPRPRPLIMGTTSPPAAASGANTSEVLSPTPPVECLSTFLPGISERSNISPECNIEFVRAVVSARVMPRITTAISQADAW